MKKQAIIVLAMIVIMQGVSIANTASFQGLGDLPGRDFWSKAQAISGDGSVVGGRSHVTKFAEAFRWTGSGGMVGIGDLAGDRFYSNTLGFSYDGSVMVGTSNSAFGTEAFRWTESSGMVAMGDLTGGDFLSRAWGVSSDGSIIAGIGSSESGREAFRWTQATGMVGLGDLTGGDFGSWGYAISGDGSTIVGISNSASGDEAYYWTQSTGMVGIGDLSGGIFESKAWGVSNDGSVIVGYGKSESGTEVFRWTADSGMIGLGDIVGGNFNSTAFDVSADGSVIVGYGTTDLGSEAFIWTETSGMVNLKDTLVNDYGLDLTGWILSEATAISDDGLTIAGYGVNPDGNTEAWVATIPEPVIYYVDADANGANNGLSWADAFNYLQDALAAAISGDEIRIANGIYKPDEDSDHPDGTSDREASFHLINGVTILGGYAGYIEPYPNARDIDVYETLLCGDLNGDDVGNMDDPSRNENSLHVVTGSWTDETAILEGCTITAGYANGFGNPNDSGGGMYNTSGSPTLVDCTFEKNAAIYGGGIANRDYCGTKMINCTFVGNSVHSCGAGMYNWKSASTLINCMFIGNFSRYGGGARFYDSNPTLINCVFSGNFARQYGGGTYFDSSTATLTNCTFSSNTADYWESGLGGGIYNHEGNSELTLTNCVFWNNCDSGGTDESAQINGGTPVINYCCIQSWTGDWGGLGNIGDYPMFVRNPDNGGDGWGIGNKPEYGDLLSIGENDDFGALYLLSDSPCIDAGDPCYIAEPDETDIDGNPRVIGGRIDMGAYEVTPLDLLLELSENLDAMSLPKGIANSLLAKLDAALQKLEDDNENNDTAAINLLEAFINAIEAQRGKKISDADADALIAAAQEIIELLSNG